jgi:hypothetical protein
MAQRLDLLSNASATGNAQQAVGGRYIFAVEATFSGGTVALQAKGPNGTWINVANAASANGFTDVVLADGSEVRAAVASGSPTAIYATLTSVRA